MMREPKYKAEYYPDYWMPVKMEGAVTGNAPHYRVFATWVGGYASGTSWKINSGITRLETDEDFYYFYGTTGSCYACRKDGDATYRTDSYGSSVLDHYTKQYPDQFLPIYDMPDIENIDWSCGDK